MALSRRSIQLLCTFLHESWMAQLEKYTFIFNVFYMSIKPKSREEQNVWRISSILILKYYADEGALLDFGCFSWLVITIHLTSNVNVKINISTSNWMLKRQPNWKVMNSACAHDVPSNKVKRKIFKCFSFYVVFCSCVWVCVCGVLFSDLDKYQFRLCSAFNTNELIQRWTCFSCSFILSIGNRSRHHNETMSTILQ